MGQNAQVTAADVSVRTARATDAMAIAATMITFWRISYADILPTSVLATLNPTNAASDWRTSITSPPSTRHRIVVACEGENVVGYAVAAPAGHSGRTAGSTGELLDLVVHPDCQRRGHGSRLLSAVVEHLSSNGYLEVITWVAEPDTARNDFLTSAGFGPDGGIRTLDMGARGSASLRQHRFSATL